MGALERMEQLLAELAQVGDGDRRQAIAIGQHSIPMPLGHVGRGMT